MLKPFLFVFGAIILAGGVQGYLAGSKASIIAGTIIALLVITGAFLLDSKPTVGLILAGLGSLGIAFRFIKAFVAAPDKTAALWPAGVLSILAVIAIVLIVMAFMRRA